MKKLTVPFVVWLAAELAYVVYILSTSAGLPARVASHFNASGVANGWMARSAYTLFFSTIGVLVSAIVVAAFAAAKHGSPRRLNVPNPNYWRSPEQHPRACRILLGYGLWLGVLVCAWFAALHASVLAANATTPPRLPAMNATMLTAIFVVVVVIWAVFVWRRFAKEGGPLAQNERPV